jgi:hypothetical protein
VSVRRYGGEGFGEMRPEDVLPGDWYILKDLVKNQVGALPLAGKRASRVASLRVERSLLASTVRARWALMTALINAPHVLAVRFQPSTLSSGGGLYKHGETIALQPSNRPSPSSASSKPSPGTLSALTVYF